MVNTHRSKKSEMMPGTLELLILKTLERHREPLHGYGIARHIQRVSDDVLRVEEGSLYPALQRLAVKGWVKAEWGVSDNNRRAGGGGPSSYGDEGRGVRGRRDVAGGGAAGRKAPVRE
jgi:transcriptional regulator